MKSFSIILVFLFLLFGSSAIAEKEIKVGTIDVEKVMEKWAKFKNYSAQIEQERMAYAVLLDKASSNLNEAERNDIEYKISKILEHSNLILMEVLTNDMEEAARKIAIEKGYGVVFIKQRTVFGGTDLTEDIVKLLK